MRCLFLSTITFILSGFMIYGFAQFLHEGEQFHILKVGNCNYSQPYPPGMEFRCQSGDALSLSTIERDSAVKEVSCLYNGSRLRCTGNYKGNKNYSLGFTCPSEKGWSGDEDGSWTCNE